MVNIAQTKTLSICYFTGCRLTSFKTKAALKKHLDNYHLKIRTRENNIAACHKALAFLEEKFMDSYCEHGIQNKDSCDDCGRMKL